MHPAPDILHGSYLISEQSPASSHNTPVLSHTRSFNIPIYHPYVKKKFSISAKIFGIFFVQVYEINFGGNRGGKGRKTQDLRDGTEAVPYTLFVVRSFFSPLLVSILWRPLSPVCALGTVSLRLGHGAALTCHRHVIHYRAAASLPWKGQRFAAKVLYRRKDSVPHHLGAPHRGAGGR